MHIGSDYSFLLFKFLMLGHEFIQAIDLKRRVDILNLSYSEPSLKCFFDFLLNARSCVVIEREVVTLDTEIWWSESVLVEQQSLTDEFGSHVNQEKEGNNKWEACDNEHGEKNTFLIVELFKTIGFSSLENFFIKNGSEREKGNRIFFFLKTTICLENMLIFFGENSSGWEEVYDAK